LDVDLATECVLEPHSARNFNYGTTVVFNFAGRNHMKHIDMVEGHSPIIATAIHDGHDMREELRPFLALSEGLRDRDQIRIAVVIEGYHSPQRIGHGGDATQRIVIDGE
jgi:hypothetical protein